MSAVPFHVSRRAEAGLVFLAALALYALTRTENLALAHDSLTYLLDIEAGGARLFHPHHLLYNALAAVWLHGARLLGVTADAAAVVALLNAVAGAAGATAAYRLLRERAALPWPLALGATAGAAVSFGFWFYSVAVEVYLIPLALLLATLCVVLRPGLTRGALLLAGVLHGLAMLFHQVHVLFGLVVLAALWQRRDARPFLPATAWYVTAGAVVVIAGYGSVLLGAVDARNPADAWAWFTLYARQDAYWHPLAPSTLAKAFLGLGRAVVGGHFAFALEPVRDLAGSVFPGKSLSDEAFLVRHLGGWAAWSLLAATGTAALALLGLLVGGLRRRRRVLPSARRVARPLAVWLAVYAMFFFFWEPYNVEFWIPQATVLWLLAALLWAPAPGESPRQTSALLAGCAGLVFVVNLVGTILPATDEANDVWVHRYRPLAEVVEAGDLVVVAYPHLGVGYVQRLTEAEAVDLVAPFQTEAPPAPEAVAEAVEARLRAALAAGRRVFTEPEVFGLEPEAGAEAALVATRLREAFGPQWERLRLEPGVVYFVIEPAPRP